jgi:hypothetical protein
MEEVQFQLCNIQITHLLLLVQFRLHLPSFESYCLLRCLGNAGREAPKIFFPNFWWPKLYHREGVRKNQNFLMAKNLDSFC